MSLLKKVFGKKKAPASFPEFQQEYAQLCAKLGDLDIQIRRMESDRNTTRQEIDQLQKYFQKLRMKPTKQVAPSRPTAVPPPPTPAADTTPKPAPETAKQQAS